MEKTKNVALVLSSGGARGIAHIGVIAELESRGYTITGISGSSIGAVVGGFYAAGKLDEYTEWITALDRFNVFNLIDFSVSAKGVIKGKKVFKKLSEWMDGVTFEDLSIPFVCIAVDLLNRKELVFDSGDVLQAMRASIAIPGYLEPQIVDGNALYDGGIINPIPINRVARTDGDIVVAIDLNAHKPDFNAKEYWQEDEVEESKMKARVNALWTSASNGIGKLQRKVSNEDDDKPIEAVEKGPKMSHVGALTEMFELMQESTAAKTIEEESPEVLIEIPRTLCSTFEFHRSTELIAFGREQARIALDKYEGK